MHEFELGVWKAVFKHLLRILFAHGGTAISALNERYRAVPTFGRSTIRKFTENASALKKLAARNYEDLLQACNINLYLVYKYSCHSYSVQFLFLRDFLTNPTIATSCHYFLPSRNGIPLPNFACTRTIRLPGLINQQQN